MTTPPEPATPAATAAGTPSGSTKWLALAAMMFAVAMIFIDQTIVSIAIPTIQSELQLSEQGVQWIVNGYLLSLSAFFVLGGRLSDIFGHKRMVLLGVTIFAVSSALCGATPAGTFDEAWLITFRITQGIGAALLFPAALAVVVSAFPLKERGKALALFFGITGGLTAIGPILGGYLSTWTWRAIFWVNVPVAIIAVILTLMAHIHTKHKKEPIDYLGAVLIASGMALSVLGLQQASTWGWWDVKTIGSILLGLILLAAFFKVETRVPVPLVKVAIFKDRAFFVDNAVLFFAMMAFVPVFFFGSVYSQAVLGYSASEAGLYLLVFFAGFAPGVQVGGRMLDKSGARSSVIVGSAIAAIGFFFWAQKLTDYSLGAQWPFIVMGGAGIGLLLGPASTDAVNRSINASYGEVTGINQTIRNYGSSLGLAILGTMLINTNTSKVIETLTGFGVPQDQATAIGTKIATDGASQASGSLPPGIPAETAEQIGSAIQLDFAQANQVVFYGMSVALVIAFVVALFHPGGMVTQEKEEAVPAVGG
jgi:EmrB/QacA subfamily drug resistance transporter